MTLYYTTWLFTINLQSLTVPSHHLVNVRALPKIISTQFVFTSSCFSLFVALLLTFYSFTTLAHYLSDSNRIKSGFRRIVTYTKNNKPMIGSSHNFP